MSSGTESSLEEAMKAGIKVAMNYDGAAIVYAVLKEREDSIDDDAAQDLWDKINGKD